MSTIIYPSPIFGPVNSRRLGVSLGINLMPSDGKVCSFDCVYCECGFNADFRPKKKRPTREEVREGLEKVLKERHDNNQPLDDITFAGNGEPTGHPDFKGIVEDTMELCKKYFPEAQVSVLSNATYIYKEEVREALMLVDNNILKLDTVDMDYIKKLDRPQQPNYDVKDVIKYLKMFKGHVIIQTMFLRGDGLDNTSEHLYHRPRNTRQVAGKGAKGSTRCHQGACRGTGYQVYSQLLRDNQDKKEKQVEKRKNESEK